VLSVWSDSTIELNVRISILLKASIYPLSLDCSSVGNLDPEIFALSDCISSSLSINAVSRFCFSNSESSSLASPRAICPLGETRSLALVIAAWSVSGVFAINAKSRGSVLEASSTLCASISFSVLAKAGLILGIIPASLFR